MTENGQISHFLRQKKREKTDKFPALNVNIEKSWRGSAREKQFQIFIDLSWVLKREIILKMADSEGGKVFRLRNCIICVRKVPIAYFIDNTLNGLSHEDFPMGFTWGIFIRNFHKAQN